MMVSDDVRDLYQELILDHSKKPRNYRVLARASHHLEGYNPLCGDKFTVYLNVKGDVVKDITFEGSGCAISKASASMMTDVIKGKTVSEAKQVFQDFHRMIAGKPGDPIDETKLGKLAVFSGVCEFPIRVKCASLAWHTFKGAVEGGNQSISTE